jgi:diguanylate cyclase (GGDEF)-like protein
MTKQKQNRNSGISINALLLFSFALIALVPVSLLGVKIYNAAWDNALREVKEKHQLLAENLSSPIKIYVDNHLTILSLAAHQISEQFAKDAKPQAVTKLLSEYLQFADGFRAIMLIDDDTRILQYVDDNKHETVSGKNFGSYDFIKKTLIRNEPAVSPIIRNIITRKPALYVTAPITMPSGSDSARLSRALVAELKIEPIERLRQGIRFGEQGHSAIVDNTGHVIAHPNPDWMKEIHDMSPINVVQYMLAGKTGVTEFYSPFKKQNMIAGYTSVPELGWGVMVPQPKSELQAQVNKILFTQLGWALMGLILALITAHFLGRWITKPIKALATSGLNLSKEGFHHNLPKMRESAPKEIQQLSDAFNDAIHGLSVSRAEVEELNKSLQYKVNEATTELRQANNKLSLLARSDHLTKLANRRHFEQTLSNMTARRQEDDSTICLLLVDLDNFKRINDEYGHAAGDTVLVQIAEILDRNTRHTDLAARYAGDEFVLLIHADATIGRERAALLRAEVAAHRFYFDDMEIKVTVSIGLVTCNLAEHSDRVDDVLRRVDEAMFNAKRSGRNRVAELSVG